MLLAVLMAHPVHAANGQHMEATPLLMRLLEYCVALPYDEVSPIKEKKARSVELAQIVADSDMYDEERFQVSEIELFVDEHFECGVVASRSLYDPYVLRSEIDRVHRDGISGLNPRCHWDYSDEFPKSLACRLPKIQTSDGTEYTLKLYAGISTQGFAILGVFPMLQVSPEGFIRVF